MSYCNSPIVQLSILAVGHLGSPPVYIHRATLALRQNIFYPRLWRSLEALNYRSFLFHKWAYAQLEEDYIRLEDLNGQLVDQPSRVGCFVRKK